jgi:solute carrier family 5 (sodium-coupled monocarboxylate transporter), member 8/12
MASGTFILRTTANLAITIFTPSLALHTIIGVPLWISLMIITLITILFNLLDGLKATVMADAIQTGITFSISVFIIIQSTILAGGIGEVYDRNKNNGRLNFFNFTNDVTRRIDTTSAVIGELFMALSLLGCQQNYVQKYLSMESVKQITWY